MASRGLPIVSDKEGEIGVSEWERINTKARQGPTKGLSR